MGIQDSDNVISVAQAKARLLALGEQARAEKAARGPMGTWKGKAVVGGAVAALVVGVLLAKPIARAIKPDAPPRRRMRETLHDLWPKDGAARRQVKKAAVGGLSLGLLMKLAQPLLPHVMNYATRRYVNYRMAKAAAEQGAAGDPTGYSHGNGSSAET
jgi:hypothetical protein